MRSIPEIPILYADRDLVVCAKAPGMNVHRGSWSRPGDLHVLQTLRNQLGQKLFPVHRLDHNTSGALAFALSEAMAAPLQAALQDPSAHKRYLVLARGQPPLEFCALRPLRNERGEPQPCRTDLRCLAQLEGCALLEVTLHTGRTHQIRRHLNHLGHHVVGDTTHGKGAINRWFRQQFGLPRMFVHAWRLAFAHPRSGERLELHAPLAPDLRECLERLPGWDARRSDELEKER